MRARLMWRSSCGSSTRRAPRTSAIDQSGGRLATTDAVSTALRDAAFKEKAFGRDYGLAPTARPRLQGGRRRHRQPAGVPAGRAAVHSKPLRRRARAHGGRLQQPRGGLHARRARRRLRGLRQGPQGRPRGREAAARSTPPSRARGRPDQVLVPLRNLALHTAAARRHSPGPAFSRARRIRCGNQSSGTLLITIYRDNLTHRLIATRCVVADDAPRPEPQAGRPKRCRRPRNRSWRSTTPVKAWRWCPRS